MDSHKKTMFLMAGVFVGVILSPGLLFVPVAAPRLDYSNYLHLGIFYGWLILMSVAAQFWWLCSLSGKGPADIWRPVLVLQICVVLPILLFFPMGASNSLIGEFLGVDLTGLFGIVLLFEIVLVTWLMMTELFAPLGRAGTYSLLAAITVTALSPAILSVVLVYILYWGV